MHSFIFVNILIYRKLWCPIYGFAAVGINLQITGHSKTCSRRIFTGSVKQLLAYFSVYGTGSNAVESDAILSPLSRQRPEACMLDADIALVLAVLVQSVDASFRGCTWSNEWRTMSSIRSGDCQK